MASRKADQLFSIFNLSTATADGTNVKYLDGRSLDKGFLQIRWTAGSGGGALCL